MNQRILFDLFMRSGLGAYIPVNDHGDHLTVQRHIEQFAEMIVQESASTVQDFVDHRFPASEYPTRLKKYFGVE